MGKYNYNKTNWIGGKTVGTADIMNNLEEGVYQAHEQLENVSSQLEQIVVFANDENSLIDAITSVREGGTIKLLNDIDITAQLEISKNIVFDGCQYKLICQTEGLQSWLYVTASSVIIKNTYFDDNLKGRNIIHSNGGQNLLISNCKFTGYTKEYGYYKTDSLILIDNCKNVNIEKTKFFDTGYQYSNTTEELNRCITLNDSTSIDKCIIDSCEFNNINQGIVSVINDLVIDKCSFNKVVDNSVYTSGENLKVINCEFKNVYDEPIVTACENNIIKDNVFNFFSNKAICLSGSNMNILSVENNHFINNNVSGQVLSYREGSNCKVVNFNNNTCLLTGTTYTNNYPVILTGVSSHFNCNYNYIETQQPDNSIIIKCDSDFINFVGNNLKIVNGTRGLNRGLVNDNSNGKFTNKDNIISGARLSIGITDLNVIEPSAPYLTGEIGNHLICSQKPTYVLSKGTIVFNSSYSKVGDVVLWISNGEEWIAEKTWRPYRHHKSNTPVNWSSPNYIGEIWIGIDNAIWIGIGEDQTSNSWKKICD